jgi:hypothetical protein
VLDYGTLLAALDALSERDTASVLFSILYREDGVATVRLLEPDTLPSRLRAPLLQLVGGGLLPITPPREMGALRLRLRGGSTGAGAVERALYCPPESPRRGVMVPQTAMIEVTQGDRLPALGVGRVRLEAELSIDETGHVRDVRLTTNSGIRELDDHFVREQWVRVFFPALIDGVPIASWIRTGGARMRF